MTQKEKIQLIEDLYYFKTDDIYICKDEDINEICSLLKAFDFKVYTNDFLKASEHEGVFVLDINKCDSETLVQCSGSSIKKHYEDYILKTKNKVFIRNKNFYIVYVGKDKSGTGIKSLDNVYLDHCFVIGHE